MLNAFYDDPRAEPDLSCVDTMEPPEFVVPIFASDLVPRLLVLAAEDRKRLAVPGAWLGGSFAVSLLAFLVLTGAPLLRRGDGRRVLPAGTARFWSWLASTAAVASVAVLAVAIGMTAKSFEALALFGFLPWAAVGAWLGLAAGIAGLLALFTAVRARRLYDLPGSRVVGFFLTGLAAVALSTGLLFWGLGPF
jgi:hypothetical protein